MVSSKRAMTMGKGANKDAPIAQRNAQQHAMAHLDNELARKTLVCT
jgi:hypothetical protein